MLITLLVVTVLLHALLTSGSIMVWNTVKKTSPEQLPRVFFATMAIRMIAALGVFAAALFLIHNDMEQVKFFTIIFIVIYLLLLIFDTMYFYCSSKKI